MEIRRTVSVCDLKTSCEEIQLKRQGTQSDLLMLRPNLLRFVLTPLTAKERCRLVKNQLEQLQYEHSQLLSHTDRQTESNNKLPAENEFERANESTQVCKSGPVGMDREERPETGYELKIIQTDIEAAERRHKEMKADLDNLLRDKSQLERKVASMNSKLEIENRLKAEQHIHSRITFQIQSRRELEKSSVETRRELRENVAEVKNMVKRVQDENAVIAGYIMRKKTKMSFFHRLRRWANNLNCFRSHAPDEEQKNTSIYSTRTQA